mmetsp:Transcript_2668/g.7765  ORF Transcript_2668/g.7765 Transcript_2668/m.7765 type:complete len:226 (+) Transcript_2668:1517-2194(+)
MVRRLHIACDYLRRHQPFDAAHSRKKHALCQDCATTIPRSDFRYVVVVQRVRVLPEEGPRVRVRRREALLITNRVGAISERSDQPELEGNRCTEGEDGGWNLKNKFHKKGQRTLPNRLLRNVRRLGKLGRKLHYDHRHEEDQEHPAKLGALAPAAACAWRDDALKPPADSIHDISTSGHAISTSVARRPSWTATALWNFERVELCNADDDGEAVAKADHHWKRQE